MGMIAILSPQSRCLGKSFEQRSSKAEPDQPASLRCHIFASAVVRVRKIFGLRERVIGRKRTHMSIVEHCDPAAEVATFSFE